MLFPELAIRKTREEQWLELTRASLPQVAVSRGWPVQNDHCFQRVLLDNACQTKWTEVISKRPAYRHAPDDILANALALGYAVLNGSQDLADLNARSLRWRGKK